MKAYLGKNTLILIALGVIAVGMVTDLFFQKPLLGSMFWVPGVAMAALLGIGKELRATKYVGQTDLCPTCNGSGRVKKRE